MSERWATYEEVQELFDEFYSNDKYLPCALCTYFETHNVMSILTLESKSAVLEVSILSGFCKRYPPAPIVTGNVDECGHVVPASVHPEVRYDNYCGEFKEVELGVDVEWFVHPSEKPKKRGGDEDSQG